MIFVTKLGFSYFNKYYTEFFYDENVVFVNDKKYAILRFEKIRIIITMVITH